jgi:hypothetical protein
MDTDQLFAPGPSRDERFEVKDRWIECANLPQDHPLRSLEFFHRQMNEEIDSLESSASNLTDFPEADWELRMWLSRQCWDEARHAAMFRRLLENRGGFVGQFPVLNFQYRILTKIDSLVGRLTVQNRSFEAGGIDAITYGIDEARGSGDQELAELFDAQCADEIVHVRFANEWIRILNRRDPRNLIRMAVAMALAAKAFAAVMGKEGTEGVGYPADWESRLEAGFSRDEVRLASDLLSSRLGKQEIPETC